MNEPEITVALLALALAATFAGRWFVRRFGLHFRPIAAYRALGVLGADAVESDERVHLSFGGGDLGRSGTISTLAAAELFYRVAERLAVSPKSPVITLADAVTIPLAQDTLRRAYEYRQNLASYRAGMAAWFPEGARSAAFGAGAAAFAADYDVASGVLLGRFGAEMAFLGEAALRYDQELIAHSDLIEGQAVAFAQADEILVGEELYVGAGYLGGTALERGGIVALDVLRWVIVGAILVLALEAAL